MSMEARLVDITTLPVDGIVTTAREDLRPSPGVNAAIHEAAGPELAEACARIGFCPTGSAVITSAYSLPSRFVVHAVGPVWQGGDHGEADLLASAYRRALALAHNNRCESVALPAISTGRSGFPIADAAAIAVAVTREALEAEAYLEEVIFACHTEAELRVYQEALATTAGGV
jgi:O-acetyl-ADP-ribose deacetylase (regulator of RNase III)